jgi:hypothetical protein
MIWAALIFQTVAAAPMKLDARERLLAVGITGAGKTTWVRDHIVRDAERIVAWDVHAEYGLPTISLDELANDETILDEPRLRVAVVPDWEDPEDLSEQFVAFAGIMKTADSLTLVVDEVGLLEGKALRRLVYLATQSRHWGMPLVMVSQRAVQVPKTARDQATRIISFRQIDPEDIEALERRMGPRAQKIAKLPYHKFVGWDVSEVFREQREKQ